MEINFFLRGIIIGFSIAAPVGPIGVLCIRRTLAEGKASGLISGLGAATADAIYGCVAGFGLTFISNLLIHQQMWLRLVGGAFLCYLGLKTFFTRPSKQSVPVKGVVSLAICVHLFFDPHQSHDHSLLCGDIRRFGWRANNCSSYTRYFPSDRISFFYNYWVFILIYSFTYERCI